MRTITIILILIFIITQKLSGQGTGAFISKLTGKWDWVKTDGGVLGDHTNPGIAGYNCSEILFQEAINSGTDSITYKSAKNDSITDIGKTIITLSVTQNDTAYYIKTVKLKDPYSGFQNERIELSGDSLIYFYDPCLADCYTHTYKKDNLYHAVPIISAGHDFKVVPNPVQNKLSMDLDPAFHYPLQLKIENPLGQNFITTIVDHYTKNYEIDLGDLPGGIYVLTISCPNKLFSTKILKR